MFKVNCKNSNTMSLTLFWCFYYIFEHIYKPFSNVSIVGFEQADVNWDAFIAIEYC